MNQSQSHPRVSVILPTHNRPDLLRDAIESLLSQTYTDWEAMIVDDASDPAAELPVDQRFRALRHQTSMGGAAAKNAGASVSSADILAFLDDDDLYAPSYLERAVSVLDKHPEVDVVFMGVSWFGARAEAGQRAYDHAMQALLARVGTSNKDENVLLFRRSGLFDGLLRTVPMAFQRPVVRRESFTRIGSYQADILLWDCDWALRAALSASCAFLPEGLYLQRAEGQGFSSQQDMRAAHLKSNVLMKERLLARGLTREQRRAVKRSLSDLWFGAAWAHYLNDKANESAACLWKSAKIDLGLQHLKLLARLALRRLRGAT